MKVKGAETQIKKEVGQERRIAFNILQQVGEELHF